MATSPAPASPGQPRQEILSGYEGYRDALLLSRIPETAQGADLDTRNRILARYRAASAPAAPATEKAYYTAFKEVAGVIKERNEAVKALDPFKAEVQSLTTQLTELQSHHTALGSAVAQTLQTTEEAFAAIRKLVGTTTPTQG